MGLGAPKRRNKLSHDPNNTAWSKSTTSFGHRILCSQGWQPGDYLGAENASHADHYTAANASHIRVLLREDNLGLGAKVGGKGNAETFGLSTLSGIFGRLNGKSDIEVGKQQSNLRDAELRTYQAQRYGFMNFVRGGLLVGDKIEEEPVKQTAAKTVDGKSASAGDADSASKKRKAGDDAFEAAGDRQVLKKKRKPDMTAEIEVQPESPKVAVEKSKKGKRKRKGEADCLKDVASTAQAIEPEAVSLARPGEDSERADKRQSRKDRKTEKVSKSASEVPAADEKARLKQEKRARKEERRKRKEEKRLLKAAKSSVEDGDTSASATTVSTSLPTPATSELPSGTSTPTQDAMAFGRRAIRQRYIQQKRMASMDPKALNEILMIKAAS